MDRTYATQNRNRISVESLHIKHGANSRILVSISKIGSFRQHDTVLTYVFFGSTQKAASSEAYLNFLLVGRLTSKLILGPWVGAVLGNMSFAATIVTRLVTSRLGAVGRDVSNPKEKQIIEMRMNSEHSGCICNGLRTFRS